MRALVYTELRQVKLDEVQRPRPADGKMEIAVAAAGICGSDISGFLGRSRLRVPPLVLGHELVGSTRDGRRVVANPLSSCGQCAFCRSGATNLCAELRLLGMGGVAGCFAEYVAVPAEQVYEIPDSLPDARAVFAEPLANVVHLFRTAAPLPGFRIAIVGAGAMGSLALQMALRLGAREVLVLDVNEARLAAARRMGATLAVPAGEEGRSAARAFAGDGLELVLDASSHGSTRKMAFDLCRAGGQVVLLGMGKEPCAIDFAASVRKELRVLMSFGYTAADFERSLELLKAGAIDLTPWTAELPLAEGQMAFEKMTDSPGDTLRMLLRVR